MLCLNAVISAVACFLCVQTVLHFTLFTSTQNTNTALTLRLEKPIIPEGLDDKEKWERERDYIFDVLYAAVWDVAVLSLFVLQHCLMASQWWKDLMTELGIVTVQRSLYVLGTCWTLQYMMSHLVVIRGSPLWYIDTPHQTVWWLVFMVVHIVAWVLLYGTCLVMDLAEMIGIKQVYYQYLDVAPPMTQKSAPTRRLYGHMRHGGATCLILVLWAHPMMTYTRVVVATTLTLFMMCGFAVQEVDYVYMREQFMRKRITLRLQRGKTIDLVN